LNEEVTFLLWDTAGQEEYDSITRTYYKGAGAAVLAFSTVDRRSFDGIEKWYEKVVAECGNIVILLVQTKVDMIEKAQMTNDEVEAIARKLHLKLYRTCVMDNLNVSEVFTHLGTEFVNRGGAVGLGVQSIPAIETIGTSNSPLPDEKTTKSSVDSNRAFQLKPSVQRTGGKKQKLYFMKQCSIL